MLIKRGKTTASIKHYFQKLFLEKKKFCNAQTVPWRVIYKMFLWIIWKPACKGNKNNNKISPIAEILTSNSAIKVFTREKNFIT